MKGWAMIRSGERVELASVGARLGARVIDTLLILVVAILVTFAIRWFGDGEDAFFGFASRMTIYLVIAAVGLLYEVTMIASQDQKETANGARHCRARHTHSTLEREEPHIVA